MQGKVDTLEGLKPNVIIGRLIPAGTGFGVDPSAPRRDESEEAAEDGQTEAAEVPSPDGESPTPEEASDAETVEGRA